LIHTVYECGAMQGATDSVDPLAVALANMPEVVAALLRDHVPDARTTDPPVSAVAFLVLTHVNAAILGGVLGPASTPLHSRGRTPTSGSPLSNG
jgi:hypothetical protein